MTLLYSVILTVFHFLAVLTQEETGLDRILLESLIFILQDLCETEPLC